MFNPFYAYRLISANCGDSDYEHFLSSHAMAEQFVAAEHATLTSSYGTNASTISTRLEKQTKRKVELEKFEKEDVAAFDLVCQ